MMSYCLPKKNTGRWAYELGVSWISWSQQRCGQQMHAHMPRPSVQILLGSQQQPRFSHQPQHQIPVAGWEASHEMTTAKEINACTTQQLLGKMLTKTLQEVAEFGFLNHLSPRAVETARARFPRNPSPTGDVGHRRNQQSTDSNDIIWIPKPYMFTELFKKHQHQESSGSNIMYYLSLLLTYSCRVVQLFIVIDEALPSFLPSFIHLFIHSLIRSLVHYVHSLIPSFKILIPALKWLEVAFPFRLKQTPNGPGK